MFGTRLTVRNAWITVNFNQWCKSAPCNRNGSIPALSGRSSNPKEQAGLRSKGHPRRCGCTRRRHMYLFGRREEERLRLRQYRRLGTGSEKAVRKARATSRQLGLEPRQQPLHQSFLQDCSHGQREPCAMLDHSVESDTVLFGKSATAATVSADRLMQLHVTRAGACPHCHDEEEHPTGMPHSSF